MLANLLSPIFQFRRNIPLLIKDQEKPGIITKYIDDQQVEIQLFDEKQTCIIISDPQFIISELKEYPEDEKIQKKIEEAKKYKVSFFFWDFYLFFFLVIPFSCCFLFSPIFFSPVVCYCR